MLFDTRDLCGDTVGRGKPAASPAGTEMGE
jgi:hypothetical protein